MSERLELVTDFSTLKAGMIVVLKGCLRCSGVHRGMLLHKNNDGVWGPDERFEEKVAWQFLPKPACVTREYAAVTGDAVRARKLFRIVDGLEALDSLAASQPQKRKARA